jgi:hypothetical protein
MPLTKLLPAPLRPFSEKPPFSQLSYGKESFSAISSIPPTLDFLLLDMLYEEFCLARILKLLILNQVLSHFLIHPLTLLIDVNPQLSLPYPVLSSITCSYCISIE